jgi:hypothetical protein
MHSRQVTDGQTSRSTSPFSIGAKATRLVSGALLFAACLTGRGALDPAADMTPWDTFPDTWVATDGLGRSLPTGTEVGPPRAGKVAGLFYFLWLGRHGEEGPFDISKILATDPTAINNPQSPLWGPLYVPHHWGESIFGYYISDDEGVLAKHAQMLADAGADAVIFDVTNQLSYPRSWQALCRVWERIRRRGGRPPQIAFLCPFGDPKKVVHELYDQLYGPGLYPELWFRWEGKPLILADPGAFGGRVLVGQHDSAAALQPGHTLGQSFAADGSFGRVGGCFPTWNTTGAAMKLALHRGGPTGERLAQQEFRDVPDNAWLSLEFDPPLPPGNYYLEMSAARGRVGWWSAAKDVLPGGQAFADGLAAAGDRCLQIESWQDRDVMIRRFFTFRKPQPDYFTGPRGPGEWGWLEVHPQHAFYKTPGLAEEVAVGAAQNAVDGRLSVLSNPRSYGRSFHAGHQPGPEGQDYTGRNLAEQFGRALSLDPAFIFITGWNEWIAGRFDSKAPFFAPGPVTFVDEFNREYSRDIEPMLGGHEDAFYYQMVAGIRRYKGARTLPPVSSRPIRIDGQFGDWAGVSPEYRDDMGDPVQRDSPGWGKSTRYVNKTGRNDIIAAKVSHDAAHVYFYVRTSGPLSPCTDSNWMLLFINSDGNATNGWLGYDFVVNRTGTTPQRAFLESHLGSGYQWGRPGGIECRVSGNELELAVPRAALGIVRFPATLDFKWADNIQQTGRWSDFTLNGDAAPNDRFNYRAVLDMIP